MPEDWDWAKAPFERFFEYMENETELIELASNGIRMVVNQVHVSEALYSVADILDRPKREAASQLADSLVKGGTG